MSTENRDDAFLDDYFAAANTAEPGPDEALIMRVLGDAADISATRADATAPQERPGLWSRLSERLSLIGGMGGAMTVAASAVMGIMVGYGGGDTIATLPGLSVLSDSAIYDDAMDLFGATSFDISGLEG